MAEEIEKKEQKEGTDKKNVLKNTDKMRYIGIIFFAVVFSVLSFLITRRVVLPRIYKSRIEKQLKSELVGGDAGGSYISMGLTGRAGVFPVDTTMAKPGLIESLSSFNQVFPVDTTIAESDTGANRGGGLLEKVFGKKEGKKEKKKYRGIGEIIKVADITVNTNKSDGLRFVLVELAIEVHDKKVSQEIKDREPQIRDMFINYFRSKTALEIARLDFQEKSKQELMQKLDNLLTEGKVDSIYYTKLILQ